MNVRLSMAGIALCALLGACNSAPAGVAKTDAVQNAQLEQINAQTEPGAGRRMLFPTPQSSSADDTSGSGAPTLGQKMQAAKKPPQ